MKKNLVFALVLVFVLSISGAAFAAANPFVDVPAKHWAYDAVSKLAKAGIVDGYGDGTFRGDKTMTRYEMAQIVAKAMAKSDKADAEQKAMIDKLSVEFAAELNNLGVRVAKLEKNASNIKLSADARIRYDNMKNGDGNTWKNRFRLYMNADVNEKVAFAARYVYSDNEFGDLPANDKNMLADMNFTYKGIFGNTTNVTAGRYSLFMGQIGTLADTTGNLDGIQTKTKAGKSDFMAGYANVSRLTSVLNNKKDVVFAEYGYTFNKNFKMGLDYFKNQKNGNDYDDNYNIFGGGLTYKMGDWKVAGEYYKNSGDDANASNAGDDPTATIARLSYKGADKAKPQTWGAFVEYSKLEKNALPYGDFPTQATKVPSSTYSNGLKSWVLGTSYTLAKNVTFEGFYQFNMKDQDGNDAYKDKGDKFTRLQVNFFF